MIGYKSGDTVIVSTEPNFVSAWKGVVVGVYGQKVWITAQDDDSEDLTDEAWPVHPDNVWLISKPVVEGGTA